MMERPPQREFGKYHRSLKEDLVGPAFQCTDNFDTAAHETGEADVPTQRRHMGTDGYCAFLVERY